MARDCLQLLDAFEVEEAHLEGHSLGGLICQEVRFVELEGGHAHTLLDPEPFNARLLEHLRSC